jgi:hypothetical protein
MLLRTGKKEGRKRTKHRGEKEQESRKERTRKLGQKE